MNSNLLIKTIIAATVSATLAGCGGATEGFDPGFSAKEPVTFANPVMQMSINEGSGIIEVDLTEGAMSGGSAVTSTINISDMNFSVSPNYLTPQGPSNTISNQTISPFTEKEGKLLINSDMFNERLSTCDTTDEWGAKNADGQNIGDGIPDNPASITYTIDFAVDNGAPLTPGTALPRRTLELTINAVEELVESVLADNTSVLFGSDERLFASVLPQTACAQGLIYSVADETVATIDDQGNISTIALGTTQVTVTSEGNPEASTTVDLEVFSSFTIDITNEDLDSNGLATGTKNVPVCVHAGLAVSPTAASGETLNNDYVYSWSSENTTDFPVALEIAYGNDGMGAFSTGTDTLLSGLEFEATVSLASGTTGSTDIADIASQSVMVSVVDNLGCGLPAVFKSDFALDAPFEASGPGALKWAPNVAQGGTAVTSVAQSDVALSGTSLMLTRNVSKDDARESWVIQGDFNNNRNWNSFTYGKAADSIGIKYQYSVWVKLNQLPTQEVVIKHRLVPWKHAGLPAQLPGLSYADRFDAAGTHTGVLKATTEWQLVELIDEASQTPVWTVPETWNIVTPVFQTWGVTGLDMGEQIIIDELGIMSAQ